MKSSKIELVPVRKSSSKTLIYRLTTSRERDDNKCVVLLPQNNLACARPAAAVIIECPPDIFEEVKGQVVCNYHLNLIRSAASKYNFNCVEENSLSQTKEKSNVNTSTNGPEAA